MAENQEHNINMDGDSVSVKLATAGTYMDGNIVFNIVDNGLDTSDATAVASDIASGKTAYVNGAKITGSLGETKTSQSYSVSASDATLNLASGTVNITSPMQSDRILRQNATVIQTVAANKLGDAAVEDVIAGKTFSSANGIKLTGTAVMTAAPTVETATATPTTTGGIWGFGGTVGLTFNVSAKPIAFAINRTGTTGFWGATNTMTVNTTYVLGGVWSSGSTMTVSTAKYASSGTGDNITYSGTMGTASASVGVSDTQVVISQPSGTTLSGTYTLLYIY